MQMPQQNGSPINRLAWAKLNTVMLYLCLALIALFLLGSAGLWMAEVQWPYWSQRWFWPICLAAVVGYLTNYVAVQMLFLPYRREDGHWLRLLTLGLWRQGVVPARKSEIADAAGEQFASQVLTPERIGKELVKVAEKVLDDPDIRHRIRMMLGPMIRKHLPALVDKLTPEIMGLLTKAVENGVRKEHIVRFLEDVLAPWMTTKENRERFVDLLINALRNEIPAITRAIRNAVEVYAQTSLLRRFAYWASETFGLIDWDEVRVSLKETLASPQTRRELYDMLGKLIYSVVETVRTSEELQHSFSGLTERMRDVFGEQVQAFLQANLPEIGNRLADSPAFWNWISHEALPQVKPYVVAWLEQEGGGEFVAKKFDISGRVREAINELHIEEVHGMVNKVSGNELGAIQVLGFVLGGIAGGLMAAVLTFGEPPRDGQAERLLDRGAAQIYDRDRPEVVP